jgi:peptide/nickel transport system ATP-binding protein
MAALELDAVTITAGGKPMLSELTFDLAPGAALAIVGRANTGKTVLAEALAGYRRPGIATTGRIASTGHTILVGPADDATVLARKLSRGAALIIADEPGALLDLEARRQLLTALLTAVRDHHAALLVLTRDIRLPLAMSLDIAVLSAGTIVERGPAATLADRPRHDATRELLAAERPRTRTLARPPVGEVLLEFDKVTLRGTRPPGAWLRPQPRPLVLDLVSFTVRRGEAIGLLGGAGAGKSALLRLAAGFGHAGSGRLSFARQPYRGNDLPRETQVRMALVFSDPRAAFNPALPVGVTLTEPLRVEEQLLVDEQADGLAEAVRAVGFEPDILARLPHEFTNAELQRLALARALVGRPSLILLDEPTRTLDPVDEADFLTLFSRIRADYGMTVLVASRRLAVLRPLTDRVHVLQRGLVVEEGTPTQLQQEAQHPATLALLAAPYPGPPPVVVEPTQPDAITAPPAEIPDQPESVVSATDPVAEPTTPVTVSSLNEDMQQAAPETDSESLTETSDRPAEIHPDTDPLPSPLREREGGETGVRPPAEPVTAVPATPSPSAQPADESAESREAQMAVEGGSNRTRRVDPADDEAWA